MNFKYFFGKQEVVDYTSFSLSSRYNTVLFIACNKAQVSTLLKIMSEMEDLLWTDKTLFVSKSIDVYVY